MRNRTRSRKIKGRWTKEEHESFLVGLAEVGQNWAAVREGFVPSRTVTQIRTHSQKYFQKATRGLPFPDEPYESMKQAGGGGSVSPPLPSAAKPPSPICNGSRTFRPRAPPRDDKRLRTGSPLDHDLDHEKGGTPEFALPEMIDGASSWGGGEGGWTESKANEGDAVAAAAAVPPTLADSYPAPPMIDELPLLRLVGYPFGDDAGELEAMGGGMGEVGPLLVGMSVHEDAVHRLFLAEDSLGLL